jgi:hypothetical protein
MVIYHENGLMLVEKFVVRKSNCDVGKQTVNYGIF